MGLITQCVGDSTVTPDAGPDVTVDQNASDTGMDSVADAGSDGDGFTCDLGDASPGTLDQSFASGPKALGTFGPNAVVVDGMGRIYIGGTTGDCGTGIWAAVHRFNQDGTHDGTFGGADAAATGVCVHYDNVDSIYAIAMDPMGNVVAGGLSYNSGNNFIHATVTRLTPTGAFDTTFNATGKLDLNPYSGTHNGFAAVQGIAFYQNKIIVTGSTEAIRPGVGTRHAGFVARLNNDGSPDTGFANGLFTDTTVTGFYGVVVDAAGNVTTVGGTLATPRQLVVRRLTIAGVPDTTFGNAGVLVTDVPNDAGGPSEGRAIAQFNGRYVVGLPIPGGASGDYASGPAGVLGVTMGGAIDTTFGTSGATTVPPMMFNIGYQLTAFASECDGKLLFGSRYDDPEGGATPQRMGISRLGSNGTIDPTFGNGGASFFQATGNEVTVGVAQDPVTGRIVVAGGNQAGQLVLARFNP